MGHEVQISARDDILEVVLSCPERGNALSPAMAEAIAVAIGAIPAATRAILLRAEGADFCIGRTPVLPPKGSKATALDLRLLIADPVLDFYQKLRDAPVPVIAAVQGRAFGVGCALAGLADVCIAAESATFCVPEMDKDVPPTLVMAALADRLPRAALACLVFTRETIGAAEAQAIGLVAMICPDADLAAKAEDLVAKLRSNSAATVRGVKTFMNRQQEMSFAGRREIAALINCVVTAEKYR
jgi:enoyl-CoA hydratase/carnithine racemase